NLIATVLASAEYARRTDNTTEGWLNAALYELVNRAESFRPLLQALLAASSSDRSEAVRRFLAHPTYLNHRAGELYRPDLKPAASPSEAAFWADLLGQPRGDKFALAALFASD